MRNPMKSGNRPTTEEYKKLYQTAMKLWFRGWKKKDIAEHLELSRPTLNKIMKTGNENENKHDTIHNISR